MKPDDLKTGFDWRPFVVAAVALLVFAPFLGGKLTTWDDGTYINSNPLIEKLDLHHIGLIFTSRWHSDYIPIDILSYAIDRSIWDLNPFGYKLGNIVLHALGTALLYFLLRMMLRDRNLSLIGALLWAVHPVQVESVAWIAERKNVLSMVFFLASFMFYIRSARRERWQRYYVLSLLMFVMALMSKASVIVLPPLLVMYRMCIDRPKNWRKELLLALPFFVLAIGQAMLTVDIQAERGATEPYHGGSFFATMITMATVVWRYVFTLLFPVHLANMHSPPVYTTPFALLPLMSLIGLAALVLLCIRAWTRQRQYVFWIAWFFIGLGPVSNIVPFNTLMAERYMYIPLIGVVAIVCLALRRLLRSHVVKAELCAVLVLFSVLSINRVPVWRETFTLWADCVLQSPNALNVQFNLARSYDEKGLFSPALRRYERVLEIDPDYAPVFVNRGRIYLAMKEYDTSIRESLRAIIALMRKANGDAFEEHYALAVAALEAGNASRAEALIHSAGWEPGDLFVPYHNLALAYRNRADLQKALDTLMSGPIDRARNRDTHISGRLLAGELLQLLGRPDESLEQYKKAIEATQDGPQHPQLYNRLADSAFGCGRHDVAAFAYAESLRMDPGQPFVHYNIAVALQSLGNTAAARQHLHALLAMNPPPGLALADAARRKLDELR